MCLFTVLLDSNFLSGCIWPHFLCRYSVGKYLGSQTTLSLDSRVPSVSVLESSELRSTVMIARFITLQQATAPVSKVFHTLPMAQTKSKD